MQVALLWFFKFEWKSTSGPRHGCPSAQWHLSWHLPNVFRKGWGQLGLLAFGDLFGCIVFFPMLLWQEVLQQHKDRHWVSEYELWLLFCGCLYILQQAFCECAHHSVSEFWRLPPAPTGWSTWSALIFAKSGSMLFKSSAGGVYS